MKALNFNFQKKFTLENVKSSQKFKIKSCSNGQNGSFVAEKNLKFPHRKFPNRLARSVKYKTFVFLKICLYSEHNLRDYISKEIQCLDNVFFREESLYFSLKALAVPAKERRAFSAF